MGGVIAAGSEITAQIGADILASGGNAVSAAVAACFATSCCEPALTSLAGGGIMIISNREKKIHKAINFFANMPGLDLTHFNKKKHDFHPVVIDYSGAKQTFNVGKGSAAAGNAIFTLCELAYSLGNRPLEALTEKTIEHLRKGVILEKNQKKISQILNSIYQVTKEAKEIFIPKNGDYSLPFLFKNKKTADFLEGLTNQQWKKYYKLNFYNKILEEFSPRNGGLITKKDLRSFKSLVQSPLITKYKNCQIITTPKPAAGGELIACALNHLEKILDDNYSEEFYTKYLCYTLHSLSQLKTTFPNDTVTNLSQEWMMKHFKNNFNKPLHIIKPEPQAKGSTTHISVIDHDRTAVSVTFSHGEGCGHLIADTGIMMNNFVGEDDVLPLGFDLKTSGQRLPTMIAPTVIETRDGDLYALGSGGSSRIRSSLIQIILNLIDKKLSPEAAVSGPRIHIENGIIYSELVRENKGMEKELMSIKPLDLIEFKEKHLYFGGVHLVKLDRHGQFSGAGDPRRGGACFVVD